MILIPIFLKIASPIIAFPLSLIFNHSISLGIFPNKVKLAKVIPVYKKGSADQLNNYRPISLLPSLKGAARGRHSAMAPSLTLMF